MNHFFIRCIVSNLDFFTLRSWEICYSVNFMVNLSKRI